METRLANEEQTLRKSITVLKTEIESLRWDTFNLKIAIRAVKRVLFCIVRIFFAFVAYSWPTGAGNLWCAFYFIVGRHLTCVFLLFLCAVVFPKSLQTYDRYVNLVSSTLESSCKLLQLSQPREWRGTCLCRIQKHIGSCCPWVHLGVNVC